MCSAAYLCGDCIDKILAALAKSDVFDVELSDESKLEIDAISSGCGKG